MAKLQQIELINCDCRFKTQEKIQMHLKQEILKLMIYIKYLIVLRTVNFAHRNDLGNNMKIIVFIYSLNENFLLKTDIILGMAYN